MIVVIIIRQGGYVFIDISLLFVCFQGYTITTWLIFTKFNGKVAHGPRKKPLDFGDNPDHCGYS